VTLLGVTSCTLLGVAFSSLVRTGKSAPAVVTPVALVLQFISGVFFVFTQLPPFLQHVAAVFPLKWMCQGMRYVFLPEGFERQEIAHSWELGKVALVLAAWSVGGLILCLSTFRWKTSKDG
jgi:ABC-2 type transport system permease protein